MYNKMTKKILIGIALIGLVISMVSFSGGLASFTDAEYSSGNTFQADNMERDTGYLGRIDGVTNWNPSTQEPDESLGGNIFLLKTGGGSCQAVIKVEPKDWSNGENVIKISYRILDNYNNIYSTNIDGINRITVSGMGESQSINQNCATENVIVSPFYENGKIKAIDRIDFCYCDYYWP
uniref:Secreted protein n=1 Tax=uncultured organism TaxID=155900 RepID=M1QBN9_9ZZZZ|nr:secreted protein [uncultured organism]